MAVTLLVPAVAGVTSKPLASLVLSGQGRQAISGTVADEFCQIHREASVRKQL